MGIRGTDPPTPSDTTHTAEEFHLFPTLRRADPALDTAVDELLNQHERLAPNTSSWCQNTSGADTASSADLIPALVQDLVTLHNIIANHVVSEESMTNPVISTRTSGPV